MRRGRRRDQPCPSCGVAAPAGARWCGACGAALDGAAPSTDEPDSTPDPVPHEPADGRRSRLVTVAAITAVLGGLLVVQAAEEPPAVPAGFSSRGDGARSGVVSTVEVPAPTGVAWRVDLDVGPVEATQPRLLGSSATEHGEVVVLLDEDPAGRRVTVHDAADGEVRWTTMLPLGRRPNDTSLSDGLLLHRTADSVTLLDLDATERRWTLDRATEGPTVVTRHGVVSGSAGTGSTEVALWSLADGEPVWLHQETASSRIAQLLDAPDVVLVVLEAPPSVSTSFPALLALDPATGAVRWRLGPADLPSSPTPHPPVRVVGDTALVVGSGAIERVRLDDGAISPVADGGLDVVDVVDALDTPSGPLAVTADGTLTGLAADGSARWRTNPGPGELLDVRASGPVVVATYDAVSVVLDGATGEELGRIDDSPHLAPTTTSDGGIVHLLPSGVLARSDLTGGPQWGRETTVGMPPDLATDLAHVAVTTPTGVQVHRTADGEQLWAYAAFDERLVGPGDLTAPVLWGTTVTASPPVSQPASAGGLFGLFTETGILDWARREDRVPPRGTPVLEADLLWLPVGSQVLGFDRSNGARREVVETSIPRADVAVSGDWIAAVDAPLDGGDLWVGQRSTGRLTFRAPVRTCTPPLLHGDLVLVGTHVGDVIARELTTGEQPWGRRLGGAVCRGLAVAGDHLVTLVDDRELVWLGLDDGTVTARTTLPAAATGAPTVAGDQVLVATLDGAVSAWRVGQEQPLWRLELDAVPFGSVAVDGTTLLVRTRDGQLLGLR